MAIVYNLIFIIFAVVYFPYLLLRGKWHKGFWMRLGFFSSADLGLANKKRIWVHAVSVGEVLVVKNLLAKIRAQYPQHQIVLSTVTQTGFHVAHSVIAKEDTVIYAPVDLSCVVRKYIRAIQPVIFLNAETELWPNLLTELHRQSIPIVQVNGRLSDKAFAQYQFFKGLLKPILRTISCFCMQTALDSERMISLGAEAGRTHVVGNMKFDDAPSQDTQRTLDILKNAQAVTLIAASTHPGEEEIVLDVVRDLRDRFPNLRVIIAPRHPERAQNLMGLCQQRNFRAVKFSQLSRTPPDIQTVILVDTIGHLRSLYPLADIVFVGKSLTVKGGHNIIEPAFYAKPIIVGPFMGNFKDVTRIFMSKQALIQVSDKNSFRIAVVQLLEDPLLRLDLGRKAQETIEQHRGATEKTFSFVKEFIGAL